MIEWLYYIIIKILELLYIWLHDYITSLYTWLFYILDNFIIHTLHYTLYMDDYIMTWACFVISLILMWISLFSRSPLLKISFWQSADVHDKEWLCLRDNLSSGSFFKCNSLIPFACYLYGSLSLPCLPVLFFSLFFSVLLYPCCG